MLFLYSQSQYYFLGEDKYLQEIAQNVSIPVLCKDFIIDEYQIYKAKILGASAILLICAILDDETLRRFFTLAEKLGLSCLVEAHDENEIKRALKIQARIIGVNNRNLKDFTVDVENSLNLRSLVPENVIFVSESGIKTKEDIEKLRVHQVQAVLIGETFMRAKDKVLALKELYGKKISPKVKFCGMKTREDIAIINRYTPDYVGFIFAESKRQVSMQTASDLAKILDEKIKKVGVFVNASLAQIEEIAQKVPLDIIQLHGDEDNEFIKALLNGDVKAMNLYMNDIALATFSNFDAGKHASGRSQPERFYHGFVLGLLVEVRDLYEVRSNRESGYGRYDVILIPRNLDRDAMILEFKVKETERKNAAGNGNKKHWRRLK